MAACEFRLDNSACPEPIQARDIQSLSHFKSQEGMSFHVAIARKAAREIEDQYHWLADHPFPSMPV